MATGQGAIRGRREEGQQCIFTKSPALMGSGGQEERRKVCVMTM